MSCVWHYTSSSGEVPVLKLSGHWSYFFFAITPRSTLTWSGNVAVSSMGQVDLFKRMFNVILNYIYTLAFCIIVIVTIKYLSI